MNRFWLGLLLALVGTGAFAKKPVEIPDQAELTMLVTGSIEVEPDGSVSGWNIDKRDKLPDFVVNLIGKSASTWKFEPVLVDGAPRKAKARMSLRIVANKLADGSGFGIAIRSGHFGEEAMTPEERRERKSTDDIIAIDMAPPSFPRNAAAAGAQGTAYVVVKIDGSGKVEDAAIEQVNLRTYGTDRQMAFMRELLGKAAIGAAQRWTFRVPTTGADADRAYWLVRVPVDYRLADADGTFQDGPEYGQWMAYIPGPRTKVSWGRSKDEGETSPDAMVSGRLYLAGRELKLLTPLSG